LVYTISSATHPTEPPPKKTQSWGERGYGRIQRGSGGGSDGGPLLECGLGCISYYTFLPVGGVAFVNGTAIYDDDYPHGDMDSAEIKVGKPSINQSINESISQSVSQSINRSIDQSVSQSVDRKG
jgi:hypothetical protein